MRKALKATFLLSSCVSRRNGESPQTFEVSKARFSWPVLGVQIVRRGGQMVGSEIKLLFTGKTGEGGGGFSPLFFFFANFSPRSPERLEQARTSGLVSLVFSRQTGFAGASIRLLLH